MARREAPAFSRGNAARQNNGCATWRAIPLYFEGDGKTGLPGASTKNTGDDACLAMIPGQTAPDCIDNAGRIACQP
jgi:hypothetical protein